MVLLYGESDAHDAGEVDVGIDVKVVVVVYATIVFNCMFRPVVWLLVDKAFAGKAELVQFNRFRTMRDLCKCGLLLFFIVEHMTKSWNRR